MWIGTSKQRDERLESIPLKQAMLCLAKVAALGLAIERNELIDCWPRHGVLTLELSGGEAVRLDDWLDGATLRRRWQER